MSECSWKLVSCIPIQGISICQLHCGQLPLLGLLYLEGSRAQYEVSDMQCVVEVVGSLLLVVPPIVEPVLLSRLR
jgi:hypothetical protein